MGPHLTQTIQSWLSYYLDLSELQNNQEVKSDAKFLDLKMMSTFYLNSQFEFLYHPYLDNTFPSNTCVINIFFKFSQRNNSGEYDGYFQMYTGVDTLDHVGQICEWKNLSTVDPKVYPGECGKLSGSAGEFFPPKRDKTFVDFFSPDLCRWETKLETTLLLEECNKTWEVFLSVPISPSVKTMAAPHVWENSKLV